MKKGFTLAEILIALGIVGVIAAMTLPALSTNVQKAQAGPAFMKAMNILEQANMTLMHNTDSRRLFSACGFSANQVNSFDSAAYLQCLVDHNLINGRMITNNEPYYTYSLTQHEIIMNINSNNQNLQTKDNLIYMPGGAARTGTFIVYVDINGNRKGPNTTAHDTFSLIIDKYTGKVLANGSFEQNGGEWTSNCNRTRVGNAESCAGSIADNGGKAIYPWR